MISQHIAKSVSLKSSLIKGALCSIRGLLPLAAWRESAFMVRSLREEDRNFEDNTSILESCSICDWVIARLFAITDANNMATAASCSLVIGISCITQM